MTDAPIFDSEATVPPTRWARAVDAASEGRTEALRALAASYWYCVYAWWRRAGLDAERAAAATVSSFTRWIADAPPELADTGVARMRDWLLTRLAVLADEGVELNGPADLAIDAEWAESRYSNEPIGEPDQIFQRAWGLTVLEFTVSTLQSEYTASGEEALFVELMPFSGFDPSGDERYAAAGERVGRSGSAMRQAVFDFRTRQREILRDFVSDTLLDPADTDSELTTLLCVIDAPGADAALQPSGIGGLRPEEAFVRAMQSVRMTGVGHGLWQPPSDAEVARLFPQYEILGLLGRGGMGAVYKGRQRELDRVVAIKLLPMEVSVDRDFADRFRREARAMAKLSHPHIVTVFNFGTTSEGHLYFIMEFVEGANLQDIIRKEAMAPAQALAIVAQVCTALAFAHEKGIVHRDIKPANVMLDLEGQAKVADFGLARLSGTTEEPGFTATGAILGTLDYMAPEQKHGTQVDHRADIYSVGVMLYEMLCRETPQGAFQPPSQRIGCDVRIDTIVLKAMHQAPDRRYQSTKEMRAAVASALTPTMTAPRRRFGPSPPLPVVEPPRRGFPLLQVGFAILVAAIIGFFIYEQSKRSGSDRTTTVPETTTTASETTTTAARATPAVPEATTTTTVPGATTTAAGGTTTAPGATTKASGATTTTPGAPAARSETAKWLAEQVPQWQAAYSAEVSGPFENGVSILKSQYLAALEKNLGTSTKAAKLEDAVAFRGERDRITAGGDIAADDEPTLPSALSALRSNYRTAFTKLNADRLVKAKVVHARYDVIMAKSQTALTQKHRFDEALEMKNTRETLSAAWLQPLANAAPKAPAVAESWEDILAKLTPAIVEQTGSGWRMEKGELFSPDKKFATLPLSGDLSDTSYQVRVNLRQLKAGDVFHVVLPVGDHMTGFELDGFGGNYTGLNNANGLVGENLPGAVLGRQVKDSEPHDLEITVRLDGGNATITATLDTRSLYEWSGPTATLGQYEGWAINPPGTFGLGANGADWVVSAVMIKRLGSLGTRANPQPEPKTDSLGWTDLLAQLTPAEVERIGHGWSLKNGQLVSPDKAFATMPLPGDLSGTSYQVRVKLRQVNAKDLFRLILPVGDRMTGFEIDWNADGKYYTGLSGADGKDSRQMPGVLRGKQVKDSNPHDLEVTVRLEGANATLTTTLDARPLYTWTGSVNAPSQYKGWATAPPGSLALGTNADGWLVSELKVKRLGK